MGYQTKNMNFDEIFTFLSSALYEKEEEFEYFSQLLNEHLLDNDNPSPEDLFYLGTNLENGGGSYDEVGISLVRLAALSGHEEAKKWYEYTTNEKVA